MKCTFFKVGVVIILSILLGCVRIVVAQKIAQWDFDKLASAEYGYAIVADYDAVSGLFANTINTSESARIFYAASPSYMPGCSANIRGGAFFDVVDNPVLTGHNDGNLGFTGFSIDVFFYLRSLPGTGTNPATIVRKTGSGKSNYKNRPGYHLYVTNSGELKFYMNDWFYVKSAATVSSTAGSIKVSQWYHATATWNGNNMKLYIDEKMVNSITYTSYNDDGLFDMDTDGDLCIGGWKTLEDTYAQYINGAIDNLTIYDEAIEPTLCGRWGYSEMDFNQDCIVDIADLARFSSEWWVCTMPGQYGCVER